MANDNAQHVVRLPSRRSREGEAGAVQLTVLSARLPTSLPPRSQMSHQVTLTAKTRKHSSSTIISSSRFMLGTRAHHGIAAALGTTLASGILGKIATVLLIPMLLVYPLLPLYAADESVAPAEAPVALEPAPVETVVTTESAPVVESVPVVPTTSTSEEPVLESGSEEAIAAPEGSSDSDSAPSGEENAEESESLESSEISETQEATEEISTENEEDTPAITEEAPADTATTSDVLEPPPSDDATTTSEHVSVATEEVGGGTEAGVTTTLPSSGSSSFDTMPAGATTTSMLASEVSTAPSAPVSSGAAAPPAAASLSDSDHEITSEESVTDGETPQIDQAALARAAEEARQEALRQSIKKEVESEFTKGCLTLDGVGYYCLKNFENTISAPSASPSVSEVDARIDGSGTDKEIFITRGDTSLQLTTNDEEEAFPSKDISGRSVVWQGMVASRWQIFFANVLASASSSPDVAQLTHSSESNFNPRVDGNTVVWQGWVDNNWEIFIADRLAPTSYYSLDEGQKLPHENERLGIDHTWHVSRITTNDTHDMFPSISGGLVTWQSFRDGVWNVHAYSIKTGAVTQLSESGASENPRFAITWDERTPEGKLRMVGYDIATGKTIDLTHEARKSSGASTPYHPTDTPISQSNQAALPTGTGTSTGTSTSLRVGDGDDGIGDFNELEV